MTISYVDAGTLLATTTFTGTRSVDYPASTTSGNLLVLVVVNKSGSNTTTPASGWLSASNNTHSGGAGTDGVDDSGTVLVSVYYRIADGTEGGTTTTVSQSASSESLHARIFQFSKTTGTWDVACAKGAQNTGGSTSWSITMGSDPGIASGDVVLVASGVNGNSFSNSSQALSASGVTFGTMTEREDTGTVNGTDQRIVVTQHEVTSGTSAGAATYTMTASGSATDTPSGPTVLMRLRESTASALSITSVTPSSFDSGIAGIVIAGSGFGASQGSSTLTIGGQAQTVTAWSDTSITFTSVRGSVSPGNATLTLTKG